MSASQSVPASSTTKTIYLQTLEESTRLKFNPRENTIQCKILEGTSISSENVKDADLRNCLMERQRELELAEQKQKTTLVSKGLKRKVEDTDLSKDENSSGSGSGSVTGKKSKNIADAGNIGNGDEKRDEKEKKDEKKPESKWGSGETKKAAQDGTEQDKLLFYSKSAKVAPGKGSSENEHVKNRTLYDVIIVTPAGKDVAALTLTTNEIMKTTLQIVKNKLLTRHLDELLAKTDSYGGVLVTLKDQVVYERYFGGNVHDTEFRVMSLSKPIVALAIFLLVQDGKLKLSDTLKDWNINAPYAEKITILHLLNHRSGIYDVVNEIYFQGKPKLEKDGKSTILLDFQKDYLPRLEDDKNHPPAFAPGEQFKYNNTNYDVLCWIICLAVRNKDTGATDYIRQYIFKPLKMMHSHFHHEKSQMEAMPFESPGVPAIKENYNAFGGNAFIVCSLNDYARFLNDYSKLLTNSIVLKQFEKVYFFVTRQIMGRLVTFISHSGGGDFQHAHMQGEPYQDKSWSYAVSFIDQELCVVIAENYLGTSNIYHMLKDTIQDICLEDLVFNKNEEKEDGEEKKKKKDKT